MDIKRLKKHATESITKWGVGYIFTDEVCVYVRKLNQDDFRSYMWARAYPSEKDRNEYISHLESLGCTIGKR